MNKIKFISLIVLSVFVFAGTNNVQAEECIVAYHHGEPIYGDCNTGNGGYGDSPYGNGGYGGNNNNNNSNNGNLNVSTLSATNIDEDSATLRGDITDLDESEDYERYFEWGTDEDDLDRTASVSGTTDNEGAFSKTISGLSDDREYFYRACAEEVDGNDDDCGSIRSFTTDEDDNNSNSNNNGDDNDDSDGVGSILTTTASSVTSTSAVINGVVTNNSGSQNVWFEWGPTTTLGNRTANRVVNSYQSIVSAQIYGLTPGRAYFFRLISDSGEEGDYKAFVTNSVAVVQGGGNTNTDTSNDEDNSSGSENSDEEDESASSSNEDESTSIIETIQHFNINLVSSAKEVAPGSTVSVEVVYENLHSETLKNVVIVLDFPPGLTPTNSELGTFVSDRQIEVVIPVIPAFSKANFTVEAEVYEKLANDTFLVTVVEASYDHPVVANTRIESVNSSIIKVSNNVAVRGTSTKGGNQSANASGSGASFFPKGVIGWLILVAGIAAIVVLANQINKKKDVKKTTLKIAK